MIWEKIEKTEWHRVFVFWPKGTMDGFKVSFTHVWKRTVPVEDDHELSLDLYNVDEYHTNPDGLEDEHQKNIQGIQSDGGLYVNGKKYGGSGHEHVITEGKTLHHPKSPSKRPPPPTPPPPKRRISEDVKFKDVFKWLDTQMDKLDSTTKEAMDRMDRDMDKAMAVFDDDSFPFSDKKKKKRLKKNKEIVAILKKRKNHRLANDILERWSREGKKERRLIRYSKL